MRSIYRLEGAECLTDCARKTEEVKRHRQEIRSDIFKDIKIEIQQTGECKDCSKPEYLGPALDIR